MRSMNIIPSVWPATPFEKITDPDPRFYISGHFGESAAGSPWYDFTKLELKYLEWCPQRGNGHTKLWMFDVFALNDNIASEYITTRYIDPEMDSETTYEVITQWFTQCGSEHENCPKPTMRPLPTRVLDVGPTDGSKGPRIFPTKGVLGSYLVLSYCWAGPQPMTLTQDTMTEKMKGVSMTSLPQSLQDAVKVTRRLGFRYIWIDALCSIQDSEEDKKNELSKMAQIYKEGVMTISVASANTVHEGFLQPRKPPKTKNPPIILPYHSQVSSAVGSIALRDEHWFDEQSEPISKRGWTLQERILSPRVLFYGTSQLRWQCQTQHLSNGGVASNVMSIGSQRLDPAFFLEKSEADSHNQDLVDDWKDLVIEYQNRSISFADDKLAAIAGIATEFHRLKPGDTYLAGMWRSSLINELCWMVEPSKIPRAFGSRPEKYRAPSWSWASIDGAVSFGGSGTRVLEIVRCETTLAVEELVIGGVVDGILEVRGQMKEGRWRVGSDDLFDGGEMVGDKIIGKIFTDTAEDVDECRGSHLRVSSASGIVLREVSETVFVRIGYFEIRDSVGWKSTKWFDDCEAMVIVIK